MLRCELALAPPRPEGPLTACGLIAINPPWTLAGELEILLPALARALAAKGTYRLDRLDGTVSRPT
jgi:23S rRNA (adenine2030-N6)-methyltransferase